MKFPSARAGTKKLFVGALLEVIAAVLGIVAAVLLAIPESNKFTDVSATLLLVAGILSIVAFVFELIGLFQAKRDDRNFANAIWIILFAIIASIVSSSISMIKASWVGYVVAGLNAFTGACGIIVILYILTGISILADKLGEDAYAARGRFLRVLLTILFVVSIGLSLFTTFFKPNENVARIMGYVAIGGTAIELVSYIWYFFYLARAPKKLSK